MAGNASLLIVIADGEHARLVRASADHALHTETVIDSETAHMRAADLGDAAPGASFHTGSSAHHAVAPRHDPHDLAKAEFARSVAARLNEIATAGGFEQLVLVAPAHTLSTIEAALTALARQRLIGRLAKDLVKTPDDALWPHVRDWVRPVHRQI
jgi:protein required for attachment to host cells